MATRLLLFSTAHAATIAHFMGMFGRTIFGLIRFERKVSLVFWPTLLLPGDLPLVFQTLLPSWPWREHALFSYVYREFSHIFDFINYDSHFEQCEPKVLDGTDTEPGAVMETSSLRMVWYENPRLIEKQWHVPTNVKCELPMNRWYTCRKTPYIWRMDLATCMYKRNSMKTIISPSLI